MKRNWGHLCPMDKFLVCGNIVGNIALACNEQIFHLRQFEPLTKIKQDLYFTNIVSKLFKEEQPNQILFSFLKNGECIGYGGLVHINWIDRHAEISFIINTILDNEINFIIDFCPIANPT